MDLQRAKELLTVLADGVNPLTGECLPENDSCNQVEIVRALYTVLNNVEHKEPAAANKKKFENSGKPWSREDEEILCRMYEEGISRREICGYFKRSEGSIAARLVKLGKIQDRDQFNIR